MSLLLRSKTAKFIHLNIRKHMHTNMNTNTSMNTSMHMNNSSTTTSQRALSSVAEKQCANINIGRVKLRPRSHFNKNRNRNRIRHIHTTNNNTQRRSQSHSHSQTFGIPPAAAYAAACAIALAMETTRRDQYQDEDEDREGNIMNRGHDNDGDTFNTIPIYMNRNMNMNMNARSVSVCKCEAASVASNSTSTSTSTSTLNVKLSNNNVNAASNASKQFDNDNDNDSASVSESKLKKANNRNMISERFLSKSKENQSQSETQAQSETNNNNNSHNTIANSNQQRNVMLRRLRSLRGRNLSDKYNVDWTLCLGEGAYGSVHPARLVTTGEKVALKKITKQYTDTSSFCRETDALLRIYNNGGHPNISGLRDMYEDRDHYYLVMDLVNGGEMFDHLIQYGAYSEADAAMLMREVASALAFLHGVGVTHADLKPENLLLCSKKRVNGTIKMIDFGCALVEKEMNDKHDGDVHGDSDVHGDVHGDDSNGNNKSNDINDEIYKKNGANDNANPNPSEPSNKFAMHRTLQNWIDALKKRNNEHESRSEPAAQSTGTTAYWPPERFQNSRQPDHATDMWAVGVILFIMLTGVHPFDLTGVATDAEIAAQIKKDPSPPMTPGLTSHLSPSAINLIKMLMEKNPTDRLTADEMLHHPWIAGDEATTDVIHGSAEKLGKFKDLKAIIEAGIFSMMIENGSRDMLLSEYTPRMVYKEGTDKKAPVSSVLKRAFEALDEDGKGFVSADDLSRVVTETTGQELSDSEKKDMIKPFAEDTAGSMGLSLSSFSKVCAGLKHKHFPRGHYVFRAGDVGDAMYFINSGKVAIRTEKGKLVHILRHGDFFGEGSLLDDNNKRFSAARCATPVDLIKIKRSDFIKYIENSKSARDTLRHRWKARTLADAKAFIRLQTNVKSVSLKKGDVVYKEGDMGMSMYFVDEEKGGELDVKHGDVTVHKYMAGESFGESSLLMEKPRSSTVICASDECYLHEMMGADFLAYLETSPETKTALLNMCRKRFFKKAIKKFALEHNSGFSNDDLIKAFESADTDKNGMLELPEVRKIMHAMDPTIPEEDIVELMNFINVGENGKLSFKDFKRLFRSFEVI